MVGIEETGRAYAGKVAFLPCIDIQNTVVRGTPEDVREEARLLLGWWGTKDGGIIPNEYDRFSIGAPLENVEAAYDAFSRLGVGYCGALNGR